MDEISIKLWRQSEQKKRGEICILARVARLTLSTDYVNPANIKANNVVSTVPGAADLNPNLPTIADPEIVLKIHFQH